MVGYLLAALAYYLVFHFAAALGLAHWNWRILFAVGALPALVILYIRAYVPESPVWLAGRAQRMTPAAGTLGASIRRYWVLVPYAIAFMAALNFMSHGTQDLYATFLQKQHGFTPEVVFALSVVAALGAIAGGLAFGAFSQRIGRRACILICALAAAALVPLWAFSQTLALLALGAFCMQFMVQGAWGVYSGAPQRALTRRRTRNVSRFHLSARKRDQCRRRSNRSGLRAALPPAGRRCRLRKSDGNRRANDVGRRCVADRARLFG